MQPGGQGVTQARTRAQARSQATEEVMDQHPGYHLLIRKIIPSEVLRLRGRKNKKQSILALDLFQLKMKVEWMNGETFAIFNAVRFSSPPVERVPFF